MDQIKHVSGLGVEARVGEHLRRWRVKNGWSQLRVALDCNVSTRHLSFVETGRARPSKQLIVQLARTLQATNHELNVCLIAGGYAPEHVEELADVHPGLSGTLAEMIRRHDPYPAFVFGADWTIVRMNPGGQWLCSVLMPELWATVGCSGAGLDMVASLIHPRGLLCRMRDPARAGWALLCQLRDEQVTNRRLTAGADEVAQSLRERYPDYSPDIGPAPMDPSLHLQFVTEHGPLAFFRLQSVVGIPQQITIATPRVEMWFPADLHTRHVMERSTDS